MPDIRTERRKDYIKMLEIFSNCAGALRGKKLPQDLAWQADAENLAVKFFFHIGTSFQVQEGTILPPIAGVTSNYVDFPSVAILSRAALETYLCFNFICIQPSTMKEKAFRHDVWRLRGFLDRQRVTTITAEGRAKLQEERKVIEDLKDKIESNYLYDILGKTEKKKTLKGEWRLGKKWVDIAKASDVHEDYFVGLYAYLCSFAHSGYWGILQLSEARDRQQQEDLSSVYTFNNLILMSHFIIAYCRLFPKVQEFLDSHEEDKQFIQRYFVTIEDWEQLFKEV